MSWGQRGYWSPQKKTAWLEAEKSRKLDLIGAAEKAGGWEENVILK